MFANKVFSVVDNYNNCLIVMVFTYFAFMIILYIALQHTIVACYNIRM